MNILDKITAHKRLEVAAKQLAFPIRLLEQSAYFERSCHSLAKAVSNSETGIIAEYKRRSPSKSVINNHSSVAQVIPGYVQAGASAISVLTDTPFFGGSLEDLIQARPLASLPILRKDFIIDNYQIYEAKAHGADAILLIAACLTEKEIKEFSTLAKQLGLDVLIEIHGEDELEKSSLNTIDLIGVNNRNLKTFEVSLETSKALADKIPDRFVKISESGISSLGAVSELRPYGFQGFLIGEHFMKTNDPGVAAKNFINALV